MVSVVLPVYNRVSTVARAIESVLAQSERRVEIIAVDDGSGDGTRAVLERYPITVLAQEHRGAYAARNLALRHARGEFIAFIDSDDAWLPLRLERQLPLLARAEVGLVFGDARHVGTRAARTCFAVTPPRRGRVAAHFAWGNFIPTVTVLARKSCLEEVGGFSEERSLSSDYLTWFRIALRHELDFVDDVLADYTVHAGGMSANLGTSLEARLALFEGELARTSDPAEAAILRRLVFNLSMSLVLATVRGKARSVRHPFALARRAAFRVARREAPPWAAAFAVHQLRKRFG